MKIEKTQQEIREQVKKKAEPEKVRTVGRIVRKKGLKLFQFNVKTGVLSEIDKIDHTQETGFWNGVKYEAIKEIPDAQVEAFSIPFEAVNHKTAKKRVQAFLDGKKPLFNLNVVTAQTPPLFGATAKFQNTNV